MKKIITTAIVSSLIVGGAAFAMLPKNTSEPVKKEPHTVVKQSPEPIPSQTPAAEPEEIQPTAPAPVQPTPPKTVTNDDLLTQYGWTTLKAHIDYYSSELPNYFTDATREKSFKYINDTGSAILTLLNQPDKSGTYTLYYFNARLKNADGATFEQKWLNLGKQFGVIY